jgi:hypothetical protein
MNRIAFACFSYLLVSPAAHAAPVSDFYRLRPATVREVVPTSQELYVPNPRARPDVTASLPTGLSEIDWNTLIAVGEKVIQLIQAGKPVVNVTRDAVSVLPAGATQWNLLNGWHAPVTKVFEVTAKNYLGMTVIDLRLKVSANYGGGLDGRGKFLANVTVVPSQIYVLWGFTCNVWSEHHDPVNLGTTADPVAGLGFDLRYDYGSAMSKETGTADYFVTGSGEITP